MKKTIRFRKEWCLGGSRRMENADDYIAAYIAENGKRIECMHGFTNWSDRWYEVDGNYFETLKDAKAYCIR